SWRSDKYAPIVWQFRTSLFQGGSGDSTSHGGRVLRKEVDRRLSLSLDSRVDARALQYVYAGSNPSRPNNLPICHERRNHLLFSINAQYQSKKSNRKFFYSDISYPYRYRNLLLNSTWIKDPPMLYYSILDDESICQILLFMILIRFHYIEILNPELFRIKEKRNDEIMEVNILAFIATALFILLPTAFLLIIFLICLDSNQSEMTARLLLLLRF
ncbi:hypothetical protein G4B88_010197, partial [Cannabis sativa]